jgi:hypothetical protein
MMFEDVARRLAELDAMKQADFLRTYCAYLGARSDPRLKQVNARLDRRTREVLRWLGEENEACEPKRS